MRVGLFGADGKVGRALAPALIAAGHVVVDARREGLEGVDVAVDFTRPDAGAGNVERALAAGIPVVIGTSGFDQAEVDSAAREAGVPCFFAPNFALGAVLMMRFAAEAAAHFEHAEILELHADTKLDAPSGTAKAPAARIGGDVPIHSVRLPGLIAHQEVVFGGPGEVLTIRHDTTSRDVFAPGVLRAVAAVRELPAGLTVGLEALLRTEPGSPVGDPGS